MSGNSRRYCNIGDERSTKGCFNFTLLNSWIDFSTTNGNGFIHMTTNHELDMLATCFSDFSKYI